MDPNTQGNHFLIRDLCIILTLITQNLQDIYELYTYWMIALLLGISIFCVRAGCEIPLVSYISKHSSQNFLTSYLCRLTCITWPLRVIYGHWTYWMIALLSKIFLVWFTVVRYTHVDPAGELQLQTHIDCSLIQTCVCILQAHTDISLGAYYTPNTGFTATNASFHKKKVGWLHYTFQCLSINLAG